MINFVIPECIPLIFQTISPAFFPLTVRQDKPDRPCRMKGVDHVIACRHVANWAPRRVTVEFRKTGGEAPRGARCEP